MTAFKVIFGDIEDVILDKLPSPSYDLCQNTHYTVFRTKNGNIFIQDRYGNQLILEPYLDVQELV
jgi:hypothetical protein